MLLDILKRFNWVDILAVILLFKIIYSAAKEGLFTEFFKLLGTIFAVYLPLHYYTSISDQVRLKINAVSERFPLKFLDFLCFIILAIMGYLIFVLLRIAFHHFIKTEITQKINNWLAIILGLARSFLFCGLIMFTLFISSVEYLETSILNSYSGKYLFDAAPNTYSFIWNKITSKLMVKEKFNNTVIEIQKDFNPK